MLHDHAKSYFRQLNECYNELSLDKLEQVLEILASAQAEGRKVFVLGNGGSAATAIHMVCDLGKGTLRPDQRRLRVIGLSDNQAMMTAWANDTSYELIYREQLANLLDPGDVVIAITASGNSPNVLRAVEYANEHGATTIGFIGFGGGKLKEMVTVDITVSSTDYGIVEDLHLTLNHVLSQCLRRRLPREEPTAAKSIGA